MLHQEPTFLFHPASQDSRSYSVQRSEADDGAAEGAEEGKSEEAETKAAKEAKK